MLKSSSLLDIGESIDIYVQIEKESDSFELLFKQKVLYVDERSQDKQFHWIVGKQEVT